MQTRPYKIVLSLETYRKLEKYKLKLINSDPSQHLNDLIEVTFLSGLTRNFSFRTNLTRMLLDDFFNALIQAGQKDYEKLNEEEKSIFNDVKVIFDNAPDQVFSLKESSILPQLYESSNNTYVYNGNEIFYLEKIPDNFGIFKSELNTEVDESIKKELGFLCSPPPKSIEPVREIIFSEKPTTKIFPLVEPVEENPSWWQRNKYKVLFGVLLVSSITVGVASIAADLTGVGAAAGVPGHFLSAWLGLKAAAIGTYLAVGAVSAAPTVVVTAGGVGIQTGFFSRAKNAIINFISPPNNTLNKIEEKRNTNDPHENISHFNQTKNLIEFFTTNNKNFKKSDLIDCSTPKEGKKKSHTANEATKLKDFVNFVNIENIKPVKKKKRNWTSIELNGKDISIIRDVGFTLNEKLRTQFQITHFEHLGSNKHTIQISNSKNMPGGLDADDIATVLRCFDDIKRLKPDGNLEKKLNEANGIETKTFRPS